MCGQRYLFVSKETSQGFIQISDATKKYPNLHLDYPVYSLPILSLILFEGRSGCIYTGQLSLVKLLGQYSKTFPSVISEVWLLKSGEKSQISFSCSTELNQGNCWTKSSLGGCVRGPIPYSFMCRFWHVRPKKDTRHVRAGTSYVDHASAREFPALSGEVTCIEPPHRESKGN